MKHKFFAIVILALLVWGGNFVYGKLTSTAGETRYILTTAEKGTIISSVSGSGQVSALDQVTIKAKVSGDIIYANMQTGREIAVGSVLAQVDPTDAKRAVNDAQIGLDQAKLTLERMKGLSTAEGAIRGDKEKAKDELSKAYDDGFNVVANAYLDLPGIMSGLQTTLYATTLGVSGQTNLDFYSNEIVKAENGGADAVASRFHNDADASYQAARASYDSAFSDYKAASRFSDADTIEKLINETYETTQLVAEAVKNTNNFIQLYKDRLAANNITPRAAADTALTQITSYTGKLNSYLSNLLSSKTSIQTDKEAVINVSFNVEDQKIAVAKAERVLADAEETLANCSIRSTIAGIVATMSVKKGDSISTGGSVAVVISKKRLAQVSLNEVDVAKVQLGQKATLTFDAIDGLSLTGEVSEIDSIGTISQGVVNYTVKVGFDAQDDRIKPGMSATAAIITDIKQDILIVPNATVKAQGTSHYVEILDMAQGSGSGATSSGAGVLSFIPPRRQTVEIGIMNDSMTEIINGLKEGDSIVESTVTTAATTAVTQTGGGLGGIRFPGVGGGR